MNEHTREILQALLDGETVQVLLAGKWENADDVNHVLFEVLHQTNGLRVKPGTITLAGVTFPEPLRALPSPGDKLWIVRCVEYGIESFVWEATTSQLVAHSRGMIQATEKGAELQQRAMIRSVGGLA